MGCGSLDRNLDPKPPPPPYLTSISPPSVADPSQSVIWVCPKCSARDIRICSARDIRPEIFGQRCPDMFGWISVDIMAEFLSQMVFYSETTGFIRFLNEKMIVSRFSSGPGNRTGYPGGPRVCL